MQLCGNMDAARELRKWLADWLEAIQMQEEEEKALAAAGRARDTGQQMCYNCVAGLRSLCDFGVELRLLLRARLNSAQA